MAAPTVGSSQANTGGGVQLQDLEIGGYQQLADGSFSRAGHTAAIWNYKSLTASATTVVVSGPGQLYGFFCGTATGNITIYDNTAASGTVILAASALVVGFNSLPVSFGTGLTIVLSGAGVATAIYT